MDARIEAQLGGIGHAIPTRGSAPGGPRPQTVDAVKRAPDASAGDAQADLSDTNGDGTVEHWSYAHGGDSVTTFRPPPSGAVGANVRKVGHPPRGSTPPVQSAPGAHHAGAHPSTAAAAHHAREAYQRDGGASAPDTPATATAAAPSASAPAPAKLDAPMPAVTQPGATAALPSPRP
jgi:hypothetical protein